MKTNERLKIAFLITRAEKGGAQVHVYDLINNIKKYHDLILIIGEKGYLSESVETLSTSEYPIKIYHVPSLQRSVSLTQEIKASKHILRVLHQEQPDIVHSHTFKAGMLSRITRIFYRKPVIYTPHGWIFGSGTPMHWKIIASIIETSLSWLSDSIICVSEGDEQYVKKIPVFNHASLKVIHNGIEDSTFQKTLVTTLNNTPLIITMVSRFAEEKDQTTLIKAFAQVLNRTELSQPVRLNLVGDGDTIEQNQHLTKQLGIDNHVDFLGNRDDIPELLAQSDIFVLSTYREAFPLSILEAMRAGLPVIASHVGGIPEAITEGENGLLVPAQDINAMEAALLKLIDSPEKRKEMGKLARKRFEDKFTVQEQTRLTLLNYEHLTRQTSVPSENAQEATPK